MRAPFPPEPPPTPPGTRRGAVIAALALAAGCGGSEPAPAAADPPPVRPVVAPTLAALEAAVPEPVAPVADPDLAGDALELLRMAAETDRLRALAMADLAALGPGVVPHLAGLLVDESAEITQRQAAAEALGRIDTDWAADRLLAYLEDLRAEPRVKSFCAYGLALGTQDWITPRLVRRLRYETDRETYLWNARALADRANFSGLAGLFEIARVDADEHIRAEASAILRELTERHGLESPEWLAWHWGQGDPDGRLPPEPSSPRLRLWVWRFVRDLGDFQLRPVDDARYVLARLGPTAAHALAEALEDEDAHVRLHAAQALGRMGPRAGVAGSALVARLDDPVVGAEAAEALGRIGFPDAESELVSRLARGRPLELRVAAARALGRTGLASSADALLPVATDAAEPVELRAAAAGAHVAVAPTERAGATLALLTELLTDDRVDPAGPERALAGWLEREDAAGLAWAGELRSAWEAADRGTDAGPQDPELEAARRADRAELLRTWAAGFSFR